MGRVSVPVLHELLAVEGDLEGTFKKVLDEAKVTFVKKDALFHGYHRKLVMFDETDKTEYPDEVKELDETVINKLKYVFPTIERYFDALYQKESTNQLAKADLIVNGETIATGLPATFLLGMESRLRLVRDMLLVMPTLEPGIKWIADAQKGENVFTNEPFEERIKTAKTFMHKVLYDATKEHKAQIEKWEEVVPIGKFIRQIWNGKISSDEKSKMIGRLDTLIQAVKKARQRANTQEVDTTKVANKILSFITNY